MINENLLHNSERDRLKKSKVIINKLWHWRLYLLNKHLPQAFTWFVICLSVGSIIQVSV